MDKVIEAYPFEQDGDLNLCVENGVAYQRDMTKLMEYGPAYWDNYQRRAGTDISRKLNEGRAAFVAKHFQGEVLDIGIGNGEFIQHRPDTFGYDVNQVAIKWLLENGKYRDKFSDFNAFTFWDVLEHIPQPADYFRNMGHGDWLFTSIPIINDLRRVRESKHYKPGEHLYYFTVSGFIQWMEKYAFRGACMSYFEVEAGREDIVSFAFRILYPE
jgi:hypothetical protein